MRGRTKQEIVRGYTKIREDKDRRRKRPWKILAALALLGGAGKLGLTYGDQIKAAAGKASAAASRWADGMRDPKNYSRTPHTAESAATPVAPPVAPEDAQRTRLFDSPTPAAAPAALSNPADLTPTPSPEAPRALAKNEWRVTGSVFDLATLKPVVGAKVTFSLEAAEPDSVETDEKGVYEIVLTKGDGWKVLTESDQHRPGQVVDLDPSYRTRDADERHATLKALNDDDLLPAPVNFKRKDSEVRLDLVVLPKHWNAR